MTRTDAMRLLRQFAGYLSGDLPELHHVVMHRFEQSVQGFMRARRRARRRR